MITVYISLILFLSILGISETSPLHQYNLTGDVGDDEVFMVRLEINEWLELYKKSYHFIYFDV